MTRRTAPAALAVLLHGRRIGVITRLAGDRCIFAFEEDYVEDPRRPTLGLGFKPGSRACRSAKSSVCPTT